MSLPTPPVPFAIAVHGGSGTILKGELGVEKLQEIRATLERAVRTGYVVLESGGTSMDAITAAITLLEDSPHFNAGKGSVFNAEGKIEMDASIMDGATLNAGAVASVHNIRNPILLARKVMSESAHVMLMGQGAEYFAREHDVEIEPDEYFHTDHRWRQLQKAQSSEDPTASYISETPERWLSTVGAVALDAQGNLAAGTSTGGMTNKRWGRVGDSPSLAPALMRTIALVLSARRAW